MPPESLEDFDVQLEQSQTDLMAANQRLNNNAVIIYSPKDRKEAKEVPTEQNKSETCSETLITPERLALDLANRDLTMYVHKQI
ncbi:unnamed protein product [Protopolystoma xenopodis]|uniref:Uncharacterized protein n=1 Tax=Protopolystoma xenopodis TaxID=117903 RepID=A0A3S5CGV4_9PLAT|nr:unnamed protein product [Protopolystoma xenopodis]